MSDSGPRQRVNVHPASEDRHRQQQRNRSSAAGVEVVLFLPSCADQTEPLPSSGFFTTPGPFHPVLLAVRARKLPLCPSQVRGPSGSMAKRRVKGELEAMEYMVLVAELTSEGGFASSRLALVDAAGMKLVEKLRSAPSLSLRPTHHGEASTAKEKERELVTTALPSRYDL